MTSSEKTFAQRLEELTAAFVSDQRPDETDVDVAAAMLEFVLNHERLRHQVNDATVEARVVDEQTVAKMRTWDSNDPAMSTVEKVLRRLAEGRGEEGIKLLQAAIQLKAHEFSNKQAQVAKRPRKSRQQPMSHLVKQIVRDAPTISQNELFNSLRRKLGSMEEPPYGYSGDSFKSHDPQYPDIKKEALRQYLHRAKKKLSL